jgi:hypothetical protein
MSLSNARVAASCVHRELLIFDDNGSLSVFFDAHGWISTLRVCMMISPMAGDYCLFSTH